MSKEKGYQWLDPTLIVGEDAQTKNILDTIDAMNACGAKKNMLVKYYMENPELRRKANIRKGIRSWTKTDAFGKIKEQTMRDDRNTFTISGIMIIMMATLFIFFLAAVIRNDYVVKFWVDAIVGSVALVLLVRNLHVKYRIVRGYTEVDWFRTLDILALIGCGLLKIAFPPYMDFTLVILLIAFVVQKKKLEKIMKSF
ncbi:hypothetical protein [Catenisphaera adipataccumulans]|uniref:Uncharacterized protein n=1 Tax=Catenisphaera adipataccumulans TaxID=700500 RepID=A0A7W8D021_9FIRM|nr:hypothetical protein [Catenisphaera adipataccumulans]MBB5183529.1 hypothetical protein [Catenisphaera adipataccumulans]